MVVAVALQIATLVAVHVQAFANLHVSVYANVRVHIKIALALAFVLSRLPALLFVRSRGGCTDLA